MKYLTATLITLTLVALLLGACVPVPRGAGRIARRCPCRNRVRTCRRVADLH